AATGNSKPRVFNAISTDPVRKSTVGKKRGRKPGTTTKAAGVTKPKTQKRKPTIKDKVEGAIEKAEGAVLKKPGKKAAGTKQMKGTDGKGARGRKVKV
ncbi:hypothetical protein ACHK7U_00410, partial [Staphylococcus hominis]|uniref:hypothetical protein n=1 Tax=Staphylococcus hominis TaxID=1290 RepID=UPI0039BF0DF9